MNRIKPVLSLGIICILTIVITGCNLFNRDIKTDTEVSRAKTSMNESLDNYNIMVSIISRTSLADVQIKMTCTVDNKNKLEYCSTSTLGIVDTEQYIDHKNNKMYTKTKKMINVDEEQDKWIVTDIKDNYENVWISINDYLKDIEVTDKGKGKLYKGTIGIKKLINAISATDKLSSIKFPTLTNKKIPIEVSINNKGYIESINSSFDYMSIREDIDIKYYNYNGNKDLKLPKI